MQLIGLAVVLTVSLILVPLAGEAQQTGKVHRIGIMWPVAGPPYESFVQELGLRSRGRHGVDDAALNRGALPWLEQVPGFRSVLLTPNAVPERITILKPDDGRFLECAVQRAVSRPIREPISVSLGIIVIDREGVFVACSGRDARSRLATRRPRCVIGCVVVRDHGQRSHHDPLADFRRRSRLDHARHRGAKQ
jgi:hypothetical protein